MGHQPPRSLAEPVGGPHRSGADPGTRLQTPVRALPCVLDIEASGFGRASWPIEVGYLRADGRARCMLVRPEPGWTHWDIAAERVHGIRRQTLLAHGVPPVEVARQLNEDLAGQTVYCDGWAHDYPWLALLFDAAGQRARFRLESVRVLLGEPQLNRLDAAQRDARAKLGLERHRASNDARSLQLALQHLLGLGATEP